jgi:hypothetical protein
VDVGDDRDRGVLGDLLQGPRILPVRHGHADDLAPRGHQRGHLLKGGVDVGRLGGGHGLHPDGRVAADLHPADLDLPGDSAFARHDTSVSAAAGHRPAATGMDWGWDSPRPGTATTP